MHASGSRSQRNFSPPVILSRKNSRLWIKDSALVNHVVQNPNVKVVVVFFPLPT